MSNQMLKFKRKFDCLQSNMIECCLSEIGVKLPSDYISFLKEYSGGYIQDDIGIKIGKDFHGGMMFLGLSSSNMTENLKFYNNMRKADPLNQAERYFTIMIIDGGEICIDTTTSKYVFFDEEYCEFHLLCSTLEELQALFEKIN